ncbi:Peroxyureidoacrylate/ureidoacrylate amidohydrolase RutB [compost metagenome]
MAKTKCDSFFKTNLEEVLKEKGIEKLTIVGMQTEFCVDTTIRAAFSKEYKNTFVRGCHTTFDTEVLKAEDIIKHHERTWGSFGELKNLEDITF